MALTKPKVTQINTASSKISDTVITINSDLVMKQGSNSLPDQGFIFNRGGTLQNRNAALIWDEQVQQFKAGMTVDHGDDVPKNIAIVENASLIVKDLNPTGNVNIQSHKGITHNNQYGWRDLIGDVTPRTGNGSGAAVLKTFSGNIREYVYGVGTMGDLRFHVPHDYAPGTDMFIHVHWGHNGNNISGNFSVSFRTIYAKGHNQQAFNLEKTTTLNVTTLNYFNTPQYMHRVDEIPLTTKGGSTSLIDTDQVEVDGLFLINFIVNTIPSITGGTTTANEPFIFTIDLHYQSTGVNTANKSPNFYG